MPATRPEQKDQEQRPPLLTKPETFTSASVREELKDKIPVSLSSEDYTIWNRLYDLYKDQKEDHTFQQKQLQNVKDWVFDTIAEDHHPHFNTKSSATEQLEEFTKFFNPSDNTFNSK